jgi:hypothetical protein
MQHFTSFFLISQSNVPVKRALFLLNAAFVGNPGFTFCVVRKKINLPLKIIK